MTGGELGWGNERVIALVAEKDVMLTKHWSVDS